MSNPHSGDYRTTRQPTVPEPSKNSRLKALAEELREEQRHENRLATWRAEWDELQVSWDEELAACPTETDRIAVNLAYERACKSLAERRPR